MMATATTLERVEIRPRKLAEYASIVPELVHEIEDLAASFQGLSVAHVSATAVGGGVAEILRSAVPLQRDVGLDSNWYIIPPDAAFFEVTKKIHNFMQGKGGALSEEEKQIYVGHNQIIAELLSQLETDVLIIHDPQPAAALSFMQGPAPRLSIWRSHIDTSQPNQSVWDFLRPYLESFDQYVFTLADYTNEGIPADATAFITPVIDPLTAKNLPMDVDDARQIIAQHGINPQLPLITQVSRFDPWKDPIGVIEAYRIAKRDIPDLQLVLLGELASDDPEGIVVYEQVKEYVGGESGIFLLVLEQDDTSVNAFQTGSDVILQKSIREGFGLTITEAMWKGTVVIGGDVGGIRLQIENGVNGFRVNSPEEAAEKIVYLHDNPDERARLGAAARESVKGKFLLPHSVRNYLNLFHARLDG